jgi:hypothetical protein
MIKGVGLGTGLQQEIIGAGIPLEIYTQGYVDLGASNTSALKRMANLAQLIAKHNLPIPPSPFVEFVADRTSGESKQDFSLVIDGKKGSGKSYSSMYLLSRYAMELAERYKKEPEDYFSLENCALLEDTERILELMKKTPKHAGLLIDDASTAVGSRNFLSESNKNFNMLLAICRTKRWFLVFNTPVDSHIDLQIRELVDATSSVYRSFHKGGFNILKITSSDVNTRGPKKQIYRKRFSFFDRLFDFWVAFSPDRLEPYKGFTDAYDRQRDEATLKLIDKIAREERLAKNPILKRDQQRQEIQDKYGPMVILMAKEGKSTKAIQRATGLSEYRINVIKHGGGITDE